MKKIITITALTILLVTFITTPATARSWDWELPSKVKTAIEDLAEIEYPNRESMRVYFYERHAQAWLDIENIRRPSGLDEREFKRIKIGADIKWPADYRMQLYRVKKQIAAWRTFKDFKQPRNIHSSFKFSELKKEYECKYPKDYEMRLYKFKESLMAHQ
ncbi:MAG: hypothetical protein KAH06_00845 [Desulfobacterales bacterium]|nr:hypothetical protein [Desulfobacterales bacterium]